MTMKKYGTNDSYDEGARAADRGKVAGDNPNRKGSLEHQNWEEGRTNRVRESGSNPE